MRWRTASPRTSSTTYGHKGSSWIGCSMTEIRRRRVGMGPGGSEARGCREDRGISFLLLPGPHQERRQPSSGGITQEHYWSSHC